MEHIKAVKHVQGNDCSIITSYYLSFCYFLLGSTHEIKKKKRFFDILFRNFFCGNCPSVF